MPVSADTFLHDEHGQGLLHMKPATWRWSRAVRAACSIGLPFAVGLALDDIMTGMWIAMGCLMMATGERYGPYREVCLTIAVSAPIGALGYLAGYLGLLPWGLVVLCMALIGLGAGLLNSRGRMLSIGTLQTLLVASIALGVPAIAPFWEPALLYLVGAAFYALLLGAEILVRGWHAQDGPETAAAPVAASTTSRPAACVGTAVQQAMALALCLGVAYSARWLDSSLHWFWIPLTVGLVMKPDFGSIHDRALQRIIGTVVGVAIGALILAAVPKGYLFVLIMGLLAGVLPWAMQRSYILQAVFLTPLILMLVDVIVPGTGSVDDALQRLLDTVIGGAIVILLGCLPWRYVSRAFRARP
ncbi:MAG: FUSC family protein [Corticimicrobacter sp.]|uniref:FUSC family protein n=1 Tax=Corticimicrobacter sp. TaxID=2678536 RepID=UPI0032DBCF79